MPELPEVFALENYFRKNVLHKRIVKAEILYPKMLLRTSRDRLLSVLKSNEITETHRHGKYLFAELKKGGHLLLHFGMTGHFSFVKREEKEKVKNTAFNFYFKDGILHLIDPRRFGKVGIVKDPEEFIKSVGFGPDALKIEKKDFMEKLSGKKTPIKKVLMDQGLIAGIGNEYSDEILYRSKVHPLSKTNEIPVKALSGIYSRIKTVLKSAMKKRMEGGKMGGFLMIEKRKDGADCKKCGSKIKHVDIGGRRSYFCPGCQKLYD